MPLPRGSLGIGGWRASPGRLSPRALSRGWTRRFRPASQLIAFFINHYKSDWLIVEVSQSLAVKSPSVIKDNVGPVGEGSIPDVPDPVFFAGLKPFHAKPSLIP